jgi:hypothetical protein
VALICLAAAILFDPVTFKMDWRGLALAALFALAVEVWSICTGLLWLYAVARARGGLGRAGSMAMGAICAFLFPIVITDLFGRARFRGVPG